MRTDDDAAAEVFPVQHAFHAETPRVHLADGPVRVRVHGELDDKPVLLSEDHVYATASDRDPLPDDDDDDLLPDVEPVSAAEEHAETAAAAVCGIRPPDDHDGDHDLLPDI